MSTRLFPAPSSVQLRPEQHDPEQHSPEQQSSEQQGIASRLSALQTWAAVPLTALTVCALGALTTPVQAQMNSTASTNPILDIGVVQRFGRTPNDTLVLEPLSGDRLTVTFESEGQPQTLTTNQIKIDVVMQPLPEPEVTERVVISTHRSFESAEDSANQWRAQGIEVELAQPQQWQVWAKRETYRTPLMRRLLLENLKANGSSTAFIDSQTQTQVPKAAFIANGYRYVRDEFEITSANSRIRVESNRDDTPTRLYGGDLRIQPNAYGNYTLVNTVPMETYLRGVVPHEIGLSAPRTAIEAQAILARTYALRNVRRFEIDNYHLCADTQCQVYWGLSGADPISDTAIANTRGQVLTYRDELVDALYSSTTGGVTAPFSDVWNGPDRPYLRAVVDSVQNLWDLNTYPLSNEANFRRFINQREGFNEVGWQLFRWRVEEDLAKIANDLRQYLSSKQHPLANFTRVEELEVLERSPAGRVQRMAVMTDRGRVILEKDEVLRALWGPNSTLFYVEPIYEAAATRDEDAEVVATSSLKLEAEDSVQAADLKLDTPQAEKQVVPAATPSPTPARVLKGYAFVGGGFGHGVGMSQTGSYRLGELGWTSDRILSFYYPGTQLQTLNSSIVFWRDPEESLMPASETTAAEPTESSTSFE
jgi:SpoIID/LytB domain protein